jgi:hypothetical protein
MKRLWAVAVGVALTSVARDSGAEDRPCVSGVYPHLAMFNNEGECGTGAVVPWAGRLWVITYGPHLVKGSSDRLYEITPGLERIVRPESAGGTHANRMIHDESEQLFIGCHAIDSRRNVRTIPWRAMPGRLTGTARHLTDPESKVYFATMEEGLYEVDVRSLAVRELIRDGNIRSTDGLDLSRDARRSSLPGYHGKGLYSGQARLIYSNNGEHGGKAQRDPTITSGALAEWRGEGDWRLVRRNQFTEVRGPGDIRGNSSPETDPVWALGWDHRSLILMLLEDGEWHAYRLPKASHSYDGAHGWNTEWPRIRDIGERDMLATMHGTFWRFPRGFSRASSAGIAPRSNYLKVIGDFCRWGERVVLGCDDSAKKEFLNVRPFKSAHAAPERSNSNLWFVEPGLLDNLGPAIGRGSVWLREDVAEGTRSDPYLFSGYDHRMVFIAHETPREVTFALEVDRRGDGRWEALRTIKVGARGSAFHVFDNREIGAWVRLVARGDASRASVHFQYRSADARAGRRDRVFDGIAEKGAAKPLGGVTRSLGGERGALGVVAVELPSGTEAGYYELDERLRLTRRDDERARSAVLKGAPPAKVYEVDAASVILTEDGKRFRLPRSDAYVMKEGPGGERTGAAADAAPENLALGARATVSSTHGAYRGANAVDGKAGEASRWVSAAGGEKWIVLDLATERTIASARITTGYRKTPESAVRDARLQVDRGGEWVDVPGARVRGNRRTVVAMNFDEPVTARRVRFVSGDTTHVRVYELELYAEPLERSAEEGGAPGLAAARVCREVATERDLLNVHGTFYELPARNAGGLPKVRPVATHGLAVHDYASHRGMLVLTGIDPAAIAQANTHIVASDDGRCAVWCGVIDDLWKLGKPRGEGGPWKDTPVEAGAPSDPYLMTGYDRKSVSLSHAGGEAVTFTVEVDPDGTGLWCRYGSFRVGPGGTETHEFPEGFSAYWVRVKADRATTATAIFRYD